MVPFIEKYKPKKIKDLILNDIVRIQFETYIENKEIPNLILTGETGVGKTSSIHCLIRNMYHRENINDMIFEIKSTEGIDIQKSLTTFCKNMIMPKEGYSKKKLVIIDESDNLLDKTKRLISSYYSKYENVSFVLTCNNLNDIIESMQSRSTVFSLDDINKVKVLDKMKYICENENIKYDMESLEYLYKISNNDIRKIINNLEVLNYSGKEINIEKVNECFGIPSNSMFDKLLEYIENKDIDNITLIIKNFNDEGYYATDIMSYFIQYITFKELENNDYKMKIINHISKTLFEISELSINNYLQLSSCIYELLDI